MADGAKTAAEHHVQAPEDTIHGEHVGEIPAGWRYKQLKIGPLKLPWYASPQVQLVMVALVCFLCPGMHCLACFPVRHHEY